MHHQPANSCCLNVVVPTMRLTSTWSLPHDAIAAATTSDRTQRPHLGLRYRRHPWWALPSPTSPASVLPSPSQGLPDDGEFVVSSDISVADVKPYGAAVRGQGNMVVVYDSRSSAGARNDAIAISGKGNISMLFNNAPVALRRRRSMPCLTLRAQLPF